MSRSSSSTTGGDQLSSLKSSEISLKSPEMGHTTRSLSLPMRDEQIFRMGWTFLCTLVWANAGARRSRPVFDVGDRGAPIWLVLAGTLEVTRRDALGQEGSVTTYQLGQFPGEVSHLAGHASLAIGRAGSLGCTALPFDSAHVRALIIGSAEIGEIIMRAFILRRVALIEKGGVGSVLVGNRGNADLIRLEGSSEGMVSLIRCWMLLGRMVAQLSSALAQTQKNCPS